ncbi:MAG: hypothetical protein QOG07_847 [Pseudonocardiales bacterium]|nr:hypothetical protein [Pseudonocardiales bacterium]
MEALQIIRSMWTQPATTFDDELIVGFHDAPNPEVLRHFAAEFIN